jgi:uncharacterized membrane protein
MMRGGQTWRRSAGVGIISSSCIALLLILFTAISWLAVCTKSPTFDEPYHATAAWVQLWRHDFRLDPQNGALWHDWCGLATRPDSLSANFDADRWREIPDNLLLQWPWLVQTLYRTPGNDAARFIDRQRAMSLVLAIGLGALTAAWATRIAGPLAAIAATVLYCFDPNFLAHAPLVKNDVAFSLVLLALSAAVWHGGRQLTWKGLVLIGLLASASIHIKLSGLFVAPILLMMLGARTLIPEPWVALGRRRTSFTDRARAAGAAILFIALIAYLFTWAVYGFRFSPTPDPNVALDMKVPSELASKAELVLRTGNAEPTTQQIAAWPISMPVSATLWMDRHRLLPQAFLNGLLYQYQASLLRDAYLFGTISIRGWWYYFPVVMLVKTPLATLAVGVISLAGALALIKTRWRRCSAASLWTALCLVIPSGFYLVVMMYSNVNAGIRHVLVFYPFAFIAAGWIAAASLRQWPSLRRLGIAMAILLMTALVAESLSVFPNYIPFFNIAAGGSRGGLYLLGDSNLDWGQDLPLLAHWQQEHSYAPLYLSYFGLADPAAYGIRYINLPGGYAQGPKVAWPSSPGFIAISATNLQGIWLQPRLYNLFYAQFTHLKPMAVLGGSIYIYAFPPSP